MCAERDNTIYRAYLPFSIHDKLAASQQYWIVQGKLNGKETYIGKCLSSARMALPGLTSYLEHRCGDRKSQLAASVTAGATKLFLTSKGQSTANPTEIVLID
jgi:hypothetical protein